MAVPLVRVQSGAGGAVVVVVVVVLVEVLVEVLVVVVVVGTGQLTKFPPLALRLKYITAFALIDGIMKGFDLPQRDVKSPLDAPVPY
jgi:hypothetical protein